MSLKNLDKITEVASSNSEDESTESSDDGINSSQNDSDSSNPSSDSESSSEEEEYQNASIQNKTTNDSDSDSDSDSDASSHLSYDVKNLNNKKTLNGIIKDILLNFALNYIFLFFNPKIRLITLMSLNQKMRKVKIIYQMIVVLMKKLSNWIKILRNL